MTKEEIAGCESHDEEMNFIGELLTEHYDMSCLLRDSIIPHAIRFFRGEACEDESEDLDSHSSDMDDSESEDGDSILSDDVDSEYEKEAQEGGH